MELKNIIKQLPHFCITFFDGKNDKYSAKTKVAYAIDIRVFLYFCSTTLPDIFPEEIKNIELSHLDQLTTDDLIAYMKWLDSYELDGAQYKNSPSGKKRKIATLRSLYKYFNGRGMLKNNPTIYIENPVIHKKEVSVITENEAERFKNVIANGIGKHGLEKHYHEKTKYRDYAIYILFLGTGIRVSELVNINDQDVDYEEQSILVTRKGGKMEKVYFGTEVMDALIEYVENERNSLLGISEEEFLEKDGIFQDGPLFVSLKKRRISVRRVEVIIKEYGRIAAAQNKKISPHALRRTYGSKLYDETGDLLLVQNALGHASPISTEYYTKFSNERLKKLKDRKI